MMHTADATLHVCWRRPQYMWIRRMRCIDPRHFNHMAGTKLHSGSLHEHFLTRHQYTYTHEAPSRYERVKGFSLVFFSFIFQTHTHTICHWMVFSLNSENKRCSYYTYISIFVIVAEFCMINMWFIDYLHKNTSTINIVSRWMKRSGWKSVSLKNLQFCKKIRRILTRRWFLMNGGL